MKNFRLELFNADIDKILSGELVISPEDRHSDEEYKELLILAQLLAKADFFSEIEGRKEKIWASIQKSDELDDEELDMVAGGLNFNEQFDDQDNKKNK